MESSDNPKAEIVEFLLTQDQWSFLQDFLPRGYSLQ
jgi:hypothetical protein